MYGSGLRLLLLSFVSLPWSIAGGSSLARLTSAAAGPYRTVGNRILDSKGRPYLVRGTELPTLTRNRADIAGDGTSLGAFSASALVSIRHRLNMNAVRLPVSPLQYENSADYRALAREVVESANRFELLVILAADPAEQLSPEALAHFWEHCATEFKGRPNLFFAPERGQSLVDAIRAAGAQQPVVVAAEFPVHDPNAIFQATPRYATTRTDEDRWGQFGKLSTDVPVLVNDLDPQLDRKSAECAAFPADPGAATRLVQDNLAYFDAHGISWILSQFRRGRMLTEYRYFNWLKLDDGWTCGEDPSPSGITIILAAHLWNTEPHGLFVVNHVNGGLVLARGGLATAYGPTLAEREVTAAAGQPLPRRMGNVSVRVTDSHGVARLARLVYAGAGWSIISFLVPENSAVGAAEVAIVRTDGSSSAAPVILADVAPGFLTAESDARGAVVGEVVQRGADGGEIRRFAAAACTASRCRTVPIPLSAGVTTTVRLAGSGIRHAGPKAAIRVTVGGVQVPVVSFGAADTVGRDQVTIQLPLELRGAGETDLVMTLGSVLSNVTRINCGAL